MLSGVTVTAALLSPVPGVPAAFPSVSVPVPVSVPVSEAAIKFIANKFIVDNLAAAFPSVSVPLIPLVCIKFIVANFAADIAVNDLISNDLISVSALLCVFGADGEVGAASLELLAVVLLLALPC